MALPHAGWRPEEWGLCTQSPLGGCSSLVNHTRDLGRRFQGCCVRRPLARRKLPSGCMLVASVSVILGKSLRPIISFLFSRGGVKTKAAPPGAYSVLFRQRPPGTSLGPCLRSLFPELTVLCRAAGLWGQTPGRLWAVVELGKAEPQEKGAASQLEEKGSGEAGVVIVGRWRGRASLCGLSARPGVWAVALKLGGTQAILAVVAPMSLQAPVPQT